MQPRKLNVAFASFPYGGNGGISSEIPALRHWYLKTIPPLKQDPRIGEVTWFDVSDTPITMTRNQAVEKARTLKADVLVMVDSDQFPDRNPERLGAKPFFSSSFDFLYKHYDRGPVMIGAPYCGPPPARNVYVFEWAGYENEPADDNFRLEQFSRERAACMAGIQECGALPTGLIMFDMRLFDIIDPPYFAYEYEGEGLPCPHCGVRKPGKQAYKASTEDVVMTRDASMNALVKLGYNATFCNWDAWAGHMKSENVGAPQLLTADMVSRQLTRAVLQGRRANEQLITVGGERNGHISYDEILSGVPAHERP